MPSQELKNPEGYAGDILILPTAGFAPNRSSFPVWARQADHKVVAEWDTTLRVVRAAANGKAATLTRLTYGLETDYLDRRAEHLSFVYGVRNIRLILGYMQQDGFIPTERSSADPRRIGIRALAHEAPRRDYAQRSLVQAQRVMLDGAHGRIPRVPGLNVPRMPSFRQLLAFSLVGKGLVDPTIGEALNTKSCFVDNTIDAGMKNLGVDSRVEAIDLLFAAGIFYPVFSDARRYLRHTFSSKETKVKTNSQASAGES